MKTNLKLLSVIGSLLLLAGIVSAEMEPQATALRVDEENSWATLGRLYVIIAATDQDETFGKVAENNGNTISRLFRENVAQKAVTVLKIPAENISRQTVLTLIANLPLREDDAVVFYYSGRGDLDRRYGQYFELSASKEELYRTEVLSAILAKRVRLCVFLTDFCDPAVAYQPPAGETAVPSEEPPAALAERDGESPVETKSAASEGSSEDAAETAPLFFSLFFYARGAVDINSASFGQASCAGQHGMGCFTDVFAGLLDINRNKMLSWRWMFPYVQEGTSLAFTNNFPHGVVIGDDTMQRSQAPILLQLGNDTLDSPTRSRIYPPGAETAPNITAHEDEERRESDQQAVIQLVQRAVGELRPFNTADRGTHENLQALDVDNTVLGVNGTPFTRELAAVPLPVPPPVPEGTRERMQQTPQASPTPIRLGIQAADNQGDGVIITRVVQGMPGQRAGLEVGDVILEINGKKISSEKEYSDAIDTATGNVTVTTRDRSRRTTTVIIRNLQN